MSIIVDDHPAVRLAACGDAEGETHSAWKIAPADRRSYYVLIRTALAWTPRAGERTAIRMSRSEAIAAVHAAHEGDCSSDPMSEEFWIT